MVLQKASRLTNSLAINIATPRDLSRQKDTDIKVFYCALYVELHVLPCGLDATPNLSRVSKQKGKQLLGEARANRPLERVLYAEVLG